MTTVSISYNERNALAKKAMEFLMSLGVFKVNEIDSPARKKTLKVIESARKGEDLTQCDTFEDYLKAVAE